jgi:L-fuconolactonase
MSAQPQATIDSHVHLWRRERTPQRWIDPDSMGAIDRDFWIDDLEAVLARHQIEGAVIVQASDSSLETSDLLEAALPATVAAVVGWVDLESPSVADDLEALRALPNAGRLAGIRHLAHIDPDPHWLARRSVSRGLDVLESAGLSFDLVVTPQQLGESATLAAEHPGITLVLDHLGKSPLRSGQLAEWEAGLGALAAHPNVFAKVSGLTIEADWNGWATSDLDHAITVALECFGPARLMWGSDWPLVELAGGYGAWLHAARDILSHLSGAEQAAIFSQTARAADRVGGRVDE